MSVSAMALAACGSVLNNYTVSETQPATLSQAILSDLSDKIPTDRINTLPRQKAAEGIKALEQNNLPAASHAFNQALRMDVQNSYLQFLNALTYHLMAVHGNGENFPLAEQGYVLAAQFDKSNWLAPFYHGLLCIDQKKWPEAQEQFARAALIRPDDPDVLYQLAQASYYTGQPERAYAILSRLDAKDEDATQARRTARGLAVTTAALGRFADAQKHLASYQDVANDAESASQLRARLEGWKGLYDAMDRGGKSKPQSRRQSQFIEPDSGFVQPNSGRQPDMPQDVPPQATFSETDMVMVDVVMIGTEADEADTRGVNLLSGLRLQFGNPLAPNPAALSVSWNKTNDRAVDGGLSDIKTLIRAIQVPSISYSLNIFNSDDSRSEVIAKPTLTALVGEPSKFFSGVDVNAAAVSGAAGDSVAIQKQIGVSLEVTPQLLPDDMVKLKVKAERTFLTTPSQSVVFQFRLDTTKTSVDANVAMKFGQTLLLSGLMERADETHRDGVPGLQDVPVVQYAFSQRQKREYSKSVLILLTPRRPNYFGAGAGGMRGGKSLDKRPAYGKSPHMGAIDQFERRYRHWFALPPNYVSIFRHLQYSQVYNEFRTGDFELERWDYSQPHSRRLKRALRYLYY